MVKTVKKHPAKNASVPYYGYINIFNLLSCPGGDHRNEPEWPGINQNGQESFLEMQCAKPGIVKSTCVKNP